MMFWLQEFTASDTGACGFELAPDPKPETLKLFPKPIPLINHKGSWYRATPEGYVHPYGLF